MAWRRASSRSAGAGVVVVGAARSGIAAAELLVRRGARVTLTETRPSFDQAERLRGRGVASNSEVTGRRRWQPPI